MSSSLLLQQCPACLVRLILIVFLMGSRWPYSCCFVGCCLQDLFKEFFFAKQQSSGLMIVVLQKTPRNPGSQSMYYVLYIYIYIYIC